MTATDVAHKGGTTFGYRVSDGDSSVAYLPDHCPTVYGPGPDGWGDFPEPGPRPGPRADVLIHDAQLTADQLPDGAAYGHAAMEYAVALGDAAGVGTVVLFHHSPRTYRRHARRRGRPVPGPGWAGGGRGRRGLRHRVLSGRLLGHPGRRAAGATRLLHPPRPSRPPEPVQPANRRTLAMRSTGRWSPTGTGTTCRWVTPASAKAAMRSAT